mmetsp:Transcript_36723/g.89836  ORF Transcript_36723/g.89836 Transcript_36723/m.89836 type:complete len:208 (+) Transcript_36723:109-732(+)
MAVSASSWSYKDKSSQVSVSASTIGAMAFQTARGGAIARNGAPAARRCRRSAVAMHGEATLGRRSMLQLTGAAVASALVRPPVTLAVTEERTLLEEFDNVVAARDGFSMLSTLLERQDYEGFRQSLRYPPMSRMRSSSVFVYSQMAPGNDQKAATKAYREMMSGVEQVDFLATQASRKQLNDVAKLTNTFDETVKKMDAFIALLPQP